MIPNLLFAGRLNREYILPLEGAPIIDRAGGSPLYAAGVATIWEKEIALLARVGEDYPNQWLQNFSKAGINTEGIQIIPGSLDLRSFRAYSEKRELSRSNPVKHFAERKLTFPKALLGDRPPEKREKFKIERHPAIPLISEIPPDYLKSKALHIAPLDFMSQGQLLTTFRAASVPIITLDRSAFGDFSKTCMAGKTLSPRATNSFIAASARASSPLIRSARRASKIAYFGSGGGTGKSASAVETHLSPSSINMTGISSMMGYFRSQSWQRSQLSFSNLSSPSFSCTQAGQRKISSKS